MSWELNYILTGMSRTTTEVTINFNSAVAMQSKRADATRDFWMENFGSILWKKWEERPCLGVDFQSFSGDESMLQDAKSTDMT